MGTINALAEVFISKVICKDAKGNTVAFPFAVGTRGFILPNREDEEKIRAFLRWQIRLGIISGILLLIAHIILSQIISSAVLLTFEGIILLPIFVWSYILYKKEFSGYARSEERKVFQWGGSFENAKIIFRSKFFKIWLWACGGIFALCALLIVGLFIFSMMNPK